MDEDERSILLQRYMIMTERQIRDLLMKPSTDYREDHYPLLIEAAKTRGLYTRIDEINNDFMKSTAAKKETEQRLAAEKPLSSRQRRLFTILPGIAYWYSFFAPEGWNQRKKEAQKCQLIGSRNYLLVALVVVVALILFSNTPISSGEIFLVIFLAVITCVISLYLFYLNVNK